MGYKMVGALTATLVLKTGLENQYYHHLSLMGLQVRADGGMGSNNNNKQGRPVA